MTTNGASLDFNLAPGSENNTKPAVPSQHQKLEAEFLARRVAVEDALAQDNNRLVNPNDNYLTRLSELDQVMNSVRELFLKHWREGSAEVKQEKSAILRHIQDKNNLRHQVAEREEKIRQLESKNQELEKANKRLAADKESLEKQVKDLDLSLKDSAQSQVNTEQLEDPTPEEARLKQEIERLQAALQKQLIQIKTAKAQIAEEEDEDAKMAQRNLLNILKKSHDQKTDKLKQKEKEQDDIRRSIAACPRCSRSMSNASTTSQSSTDSRDSKSSIATNASSQTAATSISATSGPESAIQRAKPG